MKKELYTFVLLLLVLISSCGNDGNEPYVEPEMVEFDLSYDFIESGNMTKAASDVYNDFYENYIKNKVLTPKMYNLTFTNTETGATASMEGVWDTNDGIRLLEGEYHVTGTSSPTIKSFNTHEVACDTVYIDFDEFVTIGKETKNINLTARYASYLLLFDASNTISAQYSYQYTSSASDFVESLKMYGNVFPCFLPKYRNESSIRLIRKDVSVIDINLKDMPFEIGKYYYFNDVTNSFDLPPMESGN